MTPLKSPRVRISEKSIQTACTQILELDGWRALRTDPVSDRGRGKGFGTPGMADCLFLRYGGGKTAGRPYAEALIEAMWIEFKCLTRSGKRATKATIEQHAWHRAERARGALTLIAGEDFSATVDGFIAWYKGSGLMERDLGF